MYLNQFPVIDLPATGANIRRLRQTKGLTVRDLQQFFGFEEPQAIYKWQRGQSLPTVDNLYALSALLDVPMVLPRSWRISPASSMRACSLFWARKASFRFIVFHSFALSLYPYHTDEKALCH